MIAAAPRVIGDGARRQVAGSAVQAVGAGVDQAIRRDLAREVPGRDDRRTDTAGVQVARGQSPKGLVVERALDDRRARDPPVEVLGPLAVGTDPGGERQARAFGPVPGIAQLRLDRRAVRLDRPRGGRPLHEGHAPIGRDGCGHEGPAPGRERDVRANFVAPAASSEPADRIDREPPAVGRDQRLAPALGRRRQDERGHREVALEAERGMRGDLAPGAEPIGLRPARPIHPRDPLDHGLAEAAPVARRLAR